MKRFSVCLIVAMSAALLASATAVARAPESKPPTFTTKQANRYAKKGTAEIFNGNYGLPKHLTYGSHHIEEVVTYAFQSLDRCKRSGAPTRSFFSCTVHFTSTVYTGGEYPKEEVVNVVRHERVVVEPLGAHVPKQIPETEARFPFRKGFRVVVGF